MTADGSLPTTTQIGRVALRVADLDRELEFYRDVVGLDVRRHERDAATLGAGDEPLLELIAAPDAPPRGDDETGLFHTAFRVPSRGGLADVLHRVQKRWRLDGASDHLVSEALYFRDPEDNGIEVYWDRPREEWPIEDDGTVAMDTLPLDRSDLDGESTGAVTVPDGTTVGHVHLEVSTLEAAEKFYVDELGMRVRARYGNEATFVAAGDYHHHVGLNTWNGRTAPLTGRGRGIDWFELVVPTRESLIAILDRLDDRQVEVTDGRSRAVVDDPDGIELKLRTAEGE